MSLTRTHPTPGARRRRPLSRREVWLAALMPAALLAIVGLFLPGIRSEQAQLQRRLDRAARIPHDQMHSQSRDFRTQIREAQSQLSLLDAEKQQILAELAPAAAQTLAHAAPANRSPQHDLETLTRVLAEQGLALIALHRTDGALRAGVSGWQLELVGTWAHMHKALNQAPAMAWLEIASLQMSPVGSGATESPWRRWTLNVASISASPASYLEIAP